MGDVGGSGKTTGRLIKIKQEAEGMNQTELWAIQGSKTD